LAFHDVTAKQILWGNIFLIICCLFYLTWWILAFKPSEAVRGVGWLLVPAFLTGIAAVILAVRGILSVPAGTALVPRGVLLWGGIVGYLILLAITALLFRRPITSELFLIVGWAVLALSEINTLYGVGQFSYRLTAIFTVLVGAATLISLICYVLYYNLGNRAGYFDGMIPLLMSALVMAGISVAMVVSNSQ